MTAIDSHHEPSLTPLTRVMLLHTAGWFWVDVGALQGSRAESIIRWMPGSPELPLGHLPSALSTLPLMATAWGRQVSHFNLALSPESPVPQGRSGELALAAAILWYAYAAQNQLTVVRPGETVAHDQPLVVITGSGTLDLVAESSGLSHHEVGAVADWEAKAHQLERALSDRPVVEIHVLCAGAQLRDARKAFLDAMSGRLRTVQGDHKRLENDDGVSLRFHPIVTLDELADHMIGWHSAMNTLGDNLAEELKRLQAEREEAVRSEADPSVLDSKIRQLQKRIRDGSPMQRGDLIDNRYELLEEVGSGGFATVWKAYDQKDKQLIALKALHPRWNRDETRLQAFFRGAKTMAKLHHQYIARVIQERGRHGPYHFFIMEYMASGTLDQTLQREACGEGRPRPSGWAFDCVLKVGEALAYAHEEGLLHRDVKPQNILIDPKGTPRLSDFDMVRAAETVADGTRAGFFGSFIYSDSAMLAGKPDKRSDVYSLGMTALFALHGKDLPADILRRLDSFIEEEVECNAATKRVIATAVSTKPDERYQTVTEFCNALQQARTLSPNNRAVYLSPLSRERRRVRRGWWAQLALALAMFTGMLWMVHRYNQGTQERDTAIVGREINMQWRHSYRKASFAPSQALAHLRYAAAIARNGNTFDESRSEFIDLTSRLIERGASVALVADSSQAILRMALAPDGQHLAVSRHGGELEMWHLGRQERVWKRREQEHYGFFYLHFTPDGKNLVALGNTRFRPGWAGHHAIYIRSAITGDSVTERSLPDSTIHTILIAGERFVACDRKGRIYVGKLADLIRPGDFTEYRSNIRARGCNWESGGILLSHDGNRLLSASREHLKVWSLEEPKPIVQAQMVNPNAQSLSFSPDERYVATGTARQVEVWDWQQNRKVLEYEAGVWTTPYFSPTNDRMVSIAFREQRIVLWSTATWKQVSVLYGHNARVAALAFSPDGRFLATGGYDGTIIVWDLRSGRSISRLHGHQGHLYSMEFIKSGGKLQLVSGGQDGTIRLWTVPLGSLGLQTTLDLSAPSTNMRQSSQDGRVVASVDASHAIHVHNAVTGQRIAQIDTNDQTVARYVMSPTGSWLVIAFRSGRIQRWDLDGSISQSDLVWQIDDRPVRMYEEIAISPDQRRLALWWGNDDRIIVIDLATGTVESPLEAENWFGRGTTLFIDERRILVTNDQHKASPAFAIVELDRSVGRYAESNQIGVMSVALSSESIDEHRLVATGAEGGDIKIWSLRDGRQLCDLRGHEKQVVAVAFSPDAQLLASTSWDGTARLWEVASCAERHVLRGHRDQVQHGVFSPDGRWLATGSKDATVRLWDTLTGDLVTILRGHRSKITRIVFGKQPNRLVTHDAYGVVNTWSLDSAFWVKDPIGSTGQLTNFRICPTSGEAVPRPVGAASVDSDQNETVYCQSETSER